MKKFLCYDTNDAASGKINVSTNGMLNPNSTVPSTNGAFYQQLVTDGAGNVKWEDKPFRDVKSNIPGEIYEAGYTEFDNVVIGNDLIISEEIWNVLLTKESSLIINDTGEQYEFSRETDARIEYTGDGNPSAGNLFVCKDSPKAYFYSARPDATLGVKYMVSVLYEYTKQIDPKYIKDMYYDNLQSASYAIYTGGLTEFPRSELDIPLEMWKLLLDENATITDETTGSVMTNRTVVGSEAGERVCYDTGIPGISSLFISTMYPQAYLVVSSAPDDRLGEKRTIKVSIGTIKQIDPKYIPDTTVIVNLTPNGPGTCSADKSFDEVKSLIDNGVDVKCSYNSAIFNWLGFTDEGKSTMLFEVDSFAKGVALFILFAPDSISVDFIFFREMLLPAVSASDNNKFLSVVNGAWQASSNLIVPSSTSGSSKKFKITVDDSGTITATEV